MARTRSGCPGRTPPSPLPPTSSHTLVTCPSDSLPIYFNLWTPPASLPSLPEQAPQSTVSITLISTYLFGILFSWIHDMSWASTVKCLNPLSCYQHIWTPCLSTYICNKHELCCVRDFLLFWGEKMCFCYVCCISGVNRAQLQIFLNNTHFLPSKSLKYKEQCDNL